MRWKFYKDVSHVRDNVSTGQQHWPHNCTCVTDNLPESDSSGSGKQRYIAPQQVHSFVFSHNSSENSSSADPQFSVFFFLLLNHFTHHSLEIQCKVFSSLTRTLCMLMCRNRQHGNIHWGQLRGRGRGGGGWRGGWGFWWEMQVELLQQTFERVVGYFCEICFLSEKQWKV